MRMLPVLVALLSVAGSASAADSWASDPNWHGPGWYVTMSSLMASTIEKGPFGTEDDCKVAMPSEQEQDDAFDLIGFTYQCQELKQ